MDKLSSKHKDMIKNTINKLRNIALDYKFDFTKKHHIPESCKDCMRCYSDNIDVR